jgi:hypothetical protein
MKSISRFKCYFFPPLILLGIAVFSYVTMLLWNALLPELLHLPMINFWQALGLLILSRLLFGGFGHHGRHGHHRPWGNQFRNKWETMTPEEREEFMKTRHNFGSYRSCCSSDSKDQGTK